MRIDRHENRLWLNFSDRKSICIEWSFWRSFCHIAFDCGGEGDEWKFSVALPPIAFWLTLDRFGLPTRKRKCIAAWDGGREFWLTDQREAYIQIHNWTIWFALWAKQMETDYSDPWYVRGVNWNIPDFFFGRHHYESKELERREVLIPMPEGSYPATVKLTEDSWQRARWPIVRRIRRGNIEVHAKGGIPHPGKGENSWDCGMDGLYGLTCQASTIEEAIAQTVESALHNRRRYGGSVMWKPPVEVAP